MHGFVPFDLSIPCDVFGRARLPGGMPAYEVRVCGETEEVRSSAFSLRTPWGLDRLSAADTVIIPGIENPATPVPLPVLAAIRTAWANGARIASICSGAFVLAETGLLDGRRATTHWAGAAALACRFPNVDVDPLVLFVDEGRIVTSAGASAGLDMCLHLLRRDHGQAMAAHAARLAVAPLHRDGGQAQFIRYHLPDGGHSLAGLLGWIQENVDKPLDVTALAARAGVSPRTFARRFREQTGTTPVQWLLAARVRRAQDLLETTSMAIDQVAFATGFESPVTFRARFHRVVGVSPAAYRRRFTAVASSTLRNTPADV
jgi:transcriptional regulator GlxA family with amidase domain